MPGCCTSLAIAVLLVRALTSTSLAIVLFISEPKNEPEVCEPAKPEPCKCNTSISSITSALLGMAVGIASVYQYFAQGTTAGQAKVTVDKCVQSQTTYTYVRGNQQPRFQVFVEYCE
jgi:hypothetical protein